ncbi:10921_t:CDS:2, partial [Acaulospora colombiana]
MTGVRGLSTDTPDLGEFSNRRLERASLNRREALRLSCDTSPSGRGDGDRGSSSTVESGKGLCSLSGPSARDKSAPVKVIDDATAQGRRRLLTLTNTTNDGTNHTTQSPGESHDCIGPTFVRWVLDVPNKVQVNAIPNNETKRTVLRPCFSAT